jgi:cytochrome c5
MSFWEWRSALKHARPLRNVLSRVGYSVLFATLAVVAIAESPAPAGRAPQQLYKRACALCHDTGAAMAPKLGDSAAWKPRIAQGRKTLYEHAIKGFKVMPPRGTCADCTDAELQAIVDFMAGAVK